MILSKTQALKIVGGKPKADNFRSFLESVNAYGGRISLEHPHIMAQFIAQVAHESASFRYDKELWGPTPAQRRYDTRTDLGNTAAKDGDGFKYRGRGGIQITGKYNYRQFTKWAKELASGAPDFVKEPDLINTDPWEGLVAIWYWETKSLNKYADKGDIEMVTRRINGGLNGYADRLKRYDRAALVLLNFEPSGLKMFQKAEGLAVDGISGPATRGRLHLALKALSGRPVAPPVIDDVFLEDPIDTPAFTKPAPRGKYGAIAALFAALLGRKRT